MVFETLRHGLSGLREQPVHDNPFMAARFLNLRRGHILMCLVDTLDSVTRGQIETIALGLYSDTKLDRLRPLSEVCREINLPRRGLRAVLRDPVLQRTALFYTAKEMEREYSPLVTDPDNPPSEVDAIAGSGPARPLIKGLYELVPDMQILVRENPSTPQVFSISARGRAYANAIRDIYI